MRKKARISLLSIGVVIGAALAIYYHWFRDQNAPDGQMEASGLTLDEIPFNGRRSYEYLQQICELGKRVAGSPNMLRQQMLLREHFEGLGGQVEMQEFQARHPADDKPVTLANLIVRWHPDKAERILLCTHYDTRPFPDQDLQNPHGKFIGANDGASGVALLMELAEHMPKLKCNYGVDFVMFDAEELVINERFDPYFLGSKHFARQYVNEDLPFAYKYGVLLDMVADKDLQIFYEVNSFQKARPLVQQIWQTAKELKVKEFIPRPKHEVRDDHLPLNDIAQIPTCDIIDFDYTRPGLRQSFWHTEADVPANCSAESLAKVGWVLLTWLERVE